MAAFGRPFLFIAALCSSWAATRIAIVTFSTLSLQDQAIATHPSRLHAIDVPGDVALLPESIARSPGKRILADKNVQLVRLPAVKNVRAEQFLSIRDHSGLMIADIRRSVAPLFSTLPLHPPPKGITAYFYSFWRNNGDAATVRYGGSQTGLILLLDAATLSSRFEESRVALLFRTVATPAPAMEREAALGLRWQPLPDLPVSLSVERRFRSYGSAMAGYVAGGFDNTALPGKFTLDGYGQAGFVSGRNGGPFFDAAAHANRKIMEKGPAKIAVGLGAWAGGQDGAARLDIGPSVRSDIAIGGTNFRLDVDWRFRIAGNASPGSGPAITLSTAF